MRTTQTLAERLYTIPGNLGVTGQRETLEEGTLPELGEVLALLCMGGDWIES